eukprot:gi/632979161/ref/XP_007906315.1/ PREDICTED: zinc finger HIT domain-containing protein 2 [Callorhinchus milii]
MWPRLREVGEREPQAPCGLCSAAAARYTCPRCNVRFCSASCYSRAAHGGCAQSFYREQVLGELRAREARPDPGLAWSTAPAPQLWQRLNEEQRRGFQELVRTGPGAGAGALIPLWRPWWERPRRRGPRPVQELPEVKKHGVSEGDERQKGEGDEDGEGTERKKEPGKQRQGDGHERLAEQSDTIPQINRDIPPLKALNPNASALIPFSLVNVLYSYAFCLLLVNGDLSEEEMVEEFAEAVMLVSAVFNSNCVFSCTAEALLSGVEAVRGGPYASSPYAPVDAIKATAHILRGERGPESASYTLAALSHLSRTLGKAKRLQQRQSKAEAQQLFRAQKKCEFVLSWASDNGEMLPLLSVQADTEYNSLLGSVREVEETKAQLEAAWGGQRPAEKQALIQELT